MYSSNEITDKAATLVRKLQGRRSSSKLTEEEKLELIAQGKEVNEPSARRSQISSSQLSFDNRIDNLDKLINLLGSIPEYNPNETELQVASLTTLLADEKHGLIPRPLGRKLLSRACLGV